MKCAFNDPWEGRCSRAGTETLPLSKRKVCSEHAVEWAKTRIERANKEIVEAEKVLAGAFSEDGGGA